MSQLLSGKTALILGVSNRWSLAYAIAQAFTREGAKLILTYQGDRQKRTVEELGAELDRAHSGCVQPLESGLCHRPGVHTRRREADPDLSRRSAETHG